MTGGGREWVAMEIVDLEPGDTRLTDDALPVLLELRPHLTPDSFEGVYRDGYAQGLRFTVVYDGGRCVGVAGWRFVSTTAVLKKLYVDDLVTRQDRRSEGVGRALLAELTRRAEAAGCTTLDLDSGTQRRDAHRFYMCEGLTISSFHFTHSWG